MKDKKSDLKKDQKKVRSAKAKSKALDFFKKGMGGKGNNLPPGRKDNDNE